MNKIFTLNKLLFKIASSTITLDETPIQKYVDELFENQIDDAEEEGSLDELIKIYTEIKELNFNDPDISSMIFDIVRKTRNHRGADLFFKWDSYHTYKEHERVLGKRTLQDIQKEKNDFLEKMIKKALFTDENYNKVKQEARIIIANEHPHIVRCFNDFEQIFGPDRYYIILFEYLPVLNLIIL